MFCEFAAFAQQANRDILTRSSAACEMISHFHVDVLTARQHLHKVPPSAVTPECLLVFVCLAS